MALVLADRVKETTTSTGTTAITLAGAATGYQTFSSAVGNANTTYYTIADQTGANWEVGIGTYTSSGNTLSRDTILASSNAGSLVTFTAGTKDVFVTYPAERALYTGGPLGTPSSGTLTNATGYTYVNLSGTVPTWNQNTTGNATTATTATNVAGGSAGNVHYQTGSGTTGFVSNGTTGQVLTSNGAAAPTWATASGGGGTKTISNKTGAYTIVSGDLGTIINCTSGTFTVSLTAAASLGSGFTCTIWNTGTGAITIDPNASETIDGVATLILRQGEGLAVVCNGTNWETDDKKPMRGYVENIISTDSRSTVTGSGSIALGGAATIGGAYSISWGRNTTNNSDNSICIGYSATSGLTGVTIGYTASGSSYSFSGGYAASASGLASLALGSNSTSGSESSSAIGRNSAGSGAVTATGAGAMALGGSYASGTDSFAAAIGDNTSSYGAKSANSIAIGQTALASSSNTLCIGLSSVASGIQSVAIGRACESIGVQSFTFGYGAKASQQGKIVFGTTIFSATSGQSQYGKIILVAETTTTTTVALTSNGSAASTTNQLILASGQAMAIQGTLIAKQSGSGNMAGWNITGIVSNNAGTMAVSGLALTLIGVDTIVLGVNLPTIAVDNTNKGVTITSGYKSATNIRWVATVNTSEVTV